jgi:hypothetical protein
MLLTRRRLSLQLAFWFCAFTRTAFAQSTVDQCIAASESAQRQQQQQQLAAARATLDACLAATCPAAIRDDCSKLRAAIDAEIPTLIVEVRDTRDQIVTHAKLTVDGKAVPGAASAAIPLDPGPHSVLVEAPGFGGKSVEVTLARGQKNRRELVQLVKKDPKAVYRGLGLAAGGVGAMALGVGLYYGIRAKLTYDDAEEHCPAGPRSCDADGVSGGDDAHDQASTATTAVILGGALLAGGAYLYFTNQSSEVAVGPAIGPRSVALDVRARW